MALDDLDILLGNVPQKEQIRELARYITDLNLAEAGLTRADIEQGAYWITCDHCDERYWAEDGHICETRPRDRTEPTAAEIAQGMYFDTCPIHHIEFWAEDGCPLCAAE